MKKYLIILSGLFLFVLALFAQDIGEVRSVYLQAVKALGENNLIDSESLFISIINTDDPRNNLAKYKARSYYFLGDIYFVRKYYPRAITNYRVVVQRYQNEDIYSKTLYKLGRTLVLNNQENEGAVVLNDYLAKYDNSDKLADNAMYWLGRAYIAKKEYTAALDTYQLILTKYPDTALSYDIRNTIASLTKIVDQITEDENRRLNELKGMTNEIQILKMKNEYLSKDKEMLEKMSKLLLIKQRLLEIKADKIEILQLIKEYWEK